MKLLILSLALVGSILAWPIDNLSTQISPDMPVALPALDAKSAGQPVDKLTGQIDNTASQPVDKLTGQIDNTAGQPVDKLTGQIDNTAGQPVDKLSGQIDNTAGQPVDKLTGQIDNTAGQPVDKLTGQIDNTAGQPVDKLTGQIDNIPGQLSQENTNTLIGETKTEGKSETSGVAISPVRGIATPEISSLSQLEVNKGLKTTNQEIKRETNTESESKSDEADQAEHQQAVEKDLKKVPLPNIGEAASKLASVAEDNIPSEFDSIPNPVKKIDIAPATSNSDASISESSDKSEGSATHEKRELESKPSTEQVNSNKANSEGPVVPVLPNESKDEEAKKDDDKNVKSSADDGIASPVSTKIEEASSKTDITGTVNEPAAKLAASEGMPTGQVAGFIDDTIRKVRDTVDEVKDGKDTTKVETSSAAAVVESSVKVEESTKKEDTSKKQDSSESNESKDEESGASHRTINSSQENSSEEKDDKKQNSGNNASPVSSAVAPSETAKKSDVTAKSGEPAIRPAPSYQNPPPYLTSASRCGACGLDKSMPFEVIS